MKKILCLSLVVTFFFVQDALALFMSFYIYEVTPVTTPTNDTTPDYTFRAENGSGPILVTYGGSCSSTTISAVYGYNTITFNELAPGTYSDCTITAVGSSGSDRLTVSAFTIIDTISPTISEKTSVPTPTNDATPDYTFTTDEAGTITYGGSCSSATTDATIGDNTVTFNALALGTYSDCTIIVTDGADNASNTLNISTFTITEEAEDVIEEADSVDGTTMKKYKRYKEKYKNQKSRDAHKEMKGWKKGTAEEFAKYIEYRNIYREYKHLSKRERKEIMTPEDYEKFQMYKRYKGYKEYKKLRDEVK
ncbi:MAG: hypothetical protein ABFQ53_00355 [Patescibacteria group bacterium]